MTEQLISFLKLSICSFVSLFLVVIAWMGLQIPEIAVGGPHVATLDPMFRDIIMFRRGRPR